jgi:uncharacterized membrane protein
LLLKIVLIEKTFSSSLDKVPKCVLISVHWNLQQLIA